MAKPEDVLIDSMSAKELEALEEMEKTRSMTPDEERGYGGLDRINYISKPF